MEWVKLTTNYYLDTAVMRAGEAAEVLFTRALAYVGDQENDGLVPREALPRLCPTRGPARAAALVREGLWEIVPDGWRFVTWDRHQETAEQMRARREAGRARQATHRARRSTHNGVRNAVTNASVTGTEEEEEVNAAAAARSAAAAAVISPVLDVLRSKLQAHTPLRGLRFDTLRPEQIEQIEALVAEHGDERLVAVAVSTCRAVPPTLASAFLGTWAALPPPGQRLHAVRQRYCDTHSTPLSPSGTCSSCASDQKAAR